MKRITSLAAVVAIALMTMVGNAATQSKDPRAETALQAAIKIETIDGKPEAAISAYKDVVQKYSGDRAVVAQALVRMAQCYEKLGTKQTVEARKTYQLLVSGYGDQPEVVARARTRLAALDAAEATGGPRMLGRLGATGRLLRGISSDGRHLYLDESGGSRELANAVVQIDLSDQTERVLFRAAPIALGEVFKRTVAPDGRQVAHTLTPSGQAKCTVSVAASIGAVPKPIATIDSFECDDVMWAPNSDRLLFWGEATPAGFHDFVMVDARSGSVLWRLKRDAADFDWALQPVSQNGRFVALVEPGDKGRADITVSDTQSGSTSRLSRADSVGAPIWTADGRGLLFVDGEVGARSLYLAPVSESGALGTPQQIRANVGNILLTHHSKDGSLVYRLRPEGGIPTHHLAVLDANGVATSTSVVPSIQRVCNFGWTPDSSAVVYGARLLKDYGGEIVPCTLLVIRSLADGAERTLAPGMSEIRRPKFSPDGNSLVAYGRRDGVAGIFIIDVKTGAARLVVDAPLHQTVGEDFLTADWSPDGKGLFLSRWTPSGTNRTDRLVYRDLQTGQETDRFVRSGPGRVFGTATSVASDGRVLLLLNEFENGDQFRSVIVVPPGGGTPQTVLRVPLASRFTWAAFSGDGKTITVARRAPTQTDAAWKELFRLPASGGELKPVGIAASGLDNHYPSPDGTKMFFTTFGPAPSEIQIWTMKIAK